MKNVHVSQVLMLCCQEMTLGNDLLLNFQEYLNRSTYFDIFVNSSTVPTINVADVTLLFNETFTFHWIFSGLNVNVSQSSIDPVGISVQSYISSNDTERFVETTTIIIHNSSFGSLNLYPGTKALITKCNIDAEFKDRPTLITADNSDVSIQNCHFVNFIDENGSTILFGHNNSQVIIENSVFVQHNSSKGVLFLQNNSSLHISSSVMSENVATSLGYSTITLKDGVNAVVNNTVFRGNSALAGGALIAEDQSEVILTHCTFSLNKAITGQTLTIPESLNKEMTKSNIDKNRTFAPKSISQTSFLHKIPESIKVKKLNVSETLTGHHRDQRNIKTLAHIHPTLLSQISYPQKPEVIQAPIMNTPNSNALNLDQNNTGKFTPIIRMIFNQTLSGAKDPEASTDYQTHLMNSAILGNVIPKEGVGFGGAAYVAIQSQLFVRNCTFENNSAQVIAGAIYAEVDVTIDIQGSSFEGNNAWQAGAIDVQHQVHLSIKKCAFEDNSSETPAGAIDAITNVTVDIQGTTFAGNKALQGGAIDVQKEVHLSLTNCGFEDNSAHHLAGAIFAGHNVTLDIQGTTFVSNKALYDGGAIEVQQQAHFRNTNCVFKNNSAQLTGGAVSSGVNVTLDIQETTFVGNTALQGGAVFVQYQSHLRMTNCVFNENVSQGGGAVAGGNNVTLDIKKTNFTHNRARKQGGVIDVQEKVTLSLTNCTLENNFATLNAGAIIALMNVTLKIRDTNFTGNSAPQAGAILVQLQGECHIAWCSFQGNTAKTSGGAVNIAFSSSLEIENTDFTNNNSSYGGAIFAGAQAKINAKSCNFVQNSANQEGGAINVYLSTATLQSCQFQSNNAMKGGAIDLNMPKLITISSTLLLKNVASNKGGAIAINDGSNFIIINNITCVGNQSPSGGCLDIKSVRLTLNNSIINKNFGHQLGAGIAATDSRMQIFNTLFQHNNAPQTVLHLEQTIDALIQNCHFISNVSAVLLWPTFNLRMTNSTFSLNTSDQGKIIYFVGSPLGSWMLWKTEFQINSYHTISSNKNFTKNLDRIVSFQPTRTYHGTISETQYASASPLQCSNNCWCHYFFEEAANVLNCSQTNITSLTQIDVPKDTMWLVANSNHISLLDWSKSLKIILHFDFQNSSVHQITDDFFSEITALKKISYLNLAKNNIKSFPKTLKGINFSEVYLAGNPVDCNCDMLWFADFLNTANNSSGSRIVKDYKRVLCAGGRWNGTQVYKINANGMGCEGLAEWIIAAAAGIGSFLLLIIIVVVLVARNWKEVMFLRFKYFGYLTNDKPEENEDQMRYDAFFCFSTDDFRWVREVFMTGTMGFQKMGRKLDLEKDDGFTLHLLQRDSQVGNVRSHNVIDAIDHSKRVILILSVNFLDYKWGMEAFRIAHDRVVNGRKDLLIVILKEKINVDKMPPDLRPYIRTHSYIDGTKDWKTMKKRLRFQMPHVPLKILRGEQDQEDVRDRYHERFQAPGTATEDAEDVDDDSRTSSLTHEGLTTDIDEVSEEGMERYEGGRIGSVDSVIQLDDEILNHQNKNNQENSECNTGESANFGTVDVEAVAQVHPLSSRDENENNSLSNDDTSPLLTNMH